MDENNFYEGITMKMKEKKYIYVLQMNTGTFPDKLIRFMTQYEYSHVVISLSKDCKTTYSFGRKDVNNFLNSGFIEEEQNGEFFQKFHNTKCRIYEIEVTAKQYYRMEKILKYKKDHADEYKYDFLGIVLRFFRIPIAFENKAVCSQFVAQILEEGNIFAFEKPSYFVKAQDFENCNDFKTVYEGLYLDYQPA